jgi:hypothetical protein
METHVKILAAFHLVFGALGLVGGLVIVLIFGGAAGIIGSTAPADPDARLAIPVIGLVGGIILLIILVVSVPGIIAGYGLLQRAEWARILTIILSVLHLLNIPLGTILGIYGLWVLLNQQTQPLFQQSQAPR